MSLSFPSRDVREESYSGSNPWGLAAICSGVFMVTLDGAALNLALPTIQQEFQSTVSQLEWIVTAYTLPLAGLLLTAGALGDRRGARRLFIAAMLAFSFASLLCSDRLAPIARCGCGRVASHGVITRCQKLAGQSRARPRR